MLDNSAFSLLDIDDVWTVKGWVKSLEMLGGNEGLVEGLLLALVYLSTQAAIESTIEEKNLKFLTDHNQNRTKNFKFSGHFLTVELQVPSKVFKVQLVFKFSQFNDFFQIYSNIWIF